jgi:hypothetical protein
MKQVFCIMDDLRVGPDPGFAEQGGIPFPMPQTLMAGSQCISGQADALPRL